MDMNYILKYYKFICYHTRTYHEFLQRTERFIGAKEASAPSTELKPDEEKDKEGNSDNKKYTGSSRSSCYGPEFRLFDKSVPRRPFQEPLWVHAIF